MVGLVVFAKMFAGAMKASLHGSHGGIESFGDFRVTAALLHQSEECPVLRAQLSESVPQSVQFLGIDGSGWFGDIFMLFTEGEKDAPELLAAELVDAGIAGEAEEPRFELRRRLQAVDRTDHLDEDLLGQVFDVIAPVRHGVNEARNPVLVGDDELTLGVFVALLSPANKVGQRGR
jgi:hypothetical protein